MKQLDEKIMDALYDFAIHQRTTGAQAIAQVKAAILAELPELKVYDPHDERYESNCKTEYNQALIDIKKLLQ